LQEAFNLADRVGDRPGMASYAFNIGGCFAQVGAIRDLARAEEWYLRSFGLYPPENPLARGRTLGELGLVQMVAFQESRATAQPLAEGFVHLQRAHEFYMAALELFPPDALNDLATTHAQLGATCGWLAVYFNECSIDDAMRHYREAMQRSRAAGKPSDVIGMQFNAALLLSQAGRLIEALAYARAALEGLELQGQEGTETFAYTRNMIAEIQERIDNGEG
jgi:tetratricopeptide (TPR) repeat protein